MCKLKNLGQKCVYIVLVLCVSVSIFVGARGGMCVCVCLRDFDTSVLRVVRVTCTVGVIQNNTHHHAVLFFRFRCSSTINNIIMHSR